MRLFIQKIIFVAALLLLFLLIFRRTVPYYWAATVSNEPILKRSLEDFRSKPNVNTLFIGSSQVRHHFIPDEFDKITNLNSYNLGVNGMFLGEVSYFIDNLVEYENISNLQNIIIEVQPFFEIDNKNLHTTRKKYFLDARRTQLSLRYLINKGSYKQCARVLSHWFGNLFSIGMIGDIINYHISENETSDQRLKGFCPLANKKEGFQKRYLNCDKIESNQLTYNNLIVWKELDRIQNILEEYNLNVYFLFQGNMDHCFYSEATNQIKFGDFVNYNKFSSSDLWWNNIHLSEKGAIAYTILFSNYFKQLTNS